jgi:hypothetical protein
VQGAVGWPYIQDDQVFNLQNHNAGTTTVAAISSSSITVRTYYDLFSGLGYVGRFPNNGNARYSFTTIGPAPMVGADEIRGGRTPLAGGLLQVVPNPASTWAA